MSALNPIGRLIRVQPETLYTVSTGAMRTVWMMTAYRPGKAPGQRNVECSAAFGSEVDAWAYAAEWARQGFRTTAEATTERQVHQ